MKRQFTLKEEHIKLLSKAYVVWEDGDGGAPAIDSKRPYGNGGIRYDVAEILGFKKGKDEEEPYTEKQLNLADKFHIETETALQIILCTQSFKLGVYRQTEEWDNTSWRLVKNKKQV